MQNHQVDRQHGESGLKEKVEVEEEEEEEGEEEEELLIASTAVDLVTLSGNAQTVADDVVEERERRRSYPLMIPLVNSNCIKIHVNPFAT